MLSLLLSIWRYALLLASPINFRMDGTHVPGKCVNAWETIAGQYKDCRQLLARHRCGRHLHVE